MKKLNEKITLAYLKAQGGIKDFLKRLASTPLKGEGYFDSVIKIIIALVIGGLLLAVLYAMFKDTVLPKVQEKVMEMFDFNG